jgi:hypothetical protein
MKGFKNLIISTLVGSVAIVGGILYLLMRRPEKPAPVEVIHTTPNELNVDVGTAYLECSHYGKEWQLCTSPEGWGTWPYCPAYSEFNESDLLLIVDGEIGVPTPFLHALLAQRMELAVMIMWSKFSPQLASPRIRMQHLEDTICGMTVKSTVSGCVRSRMRGNRVVKIGIINAK